jgi:hypothetical protein
VFSPEPVIDCIIIINLTFYYRQLMDLMETVYEAKQKRCNQVVAQKIKEVFLGKRVSKCIRKDVEVYSRHHALPMTMGDAKVYGWQTP